MTTIKLLIVISILLLRSSSTAESFDAFLDKFQNDEAFRIQRIEFPLVVYEILGYHLLKIRGEHTEVHTLDKTELVKEDWKIHESTRHMREVVSFIKSRNIKHASLVEVIEIGANHYRLRVIFGKKHDGITVEYDFRIRGNHWYLTEARSYHETIVSAYEMTRIQDRMDENLFEGPLYSNQ